MVWRIDDVVCISYMGACFNCVLIRCSGALIILMLSSDYLKQSSDFSENGAPSFLKWSSDYSEKEL